LTNQCGKEIYDVSNPVPPPHTHTQNCLKASKHGVMQSLSGLRGHVKNKNRNSNPKYIDYF